MNEYSIYEKNTGRFTGGRITTSRPELIEAALPEGTGIVLGAWDYLTHTVNPESGEIQACNAPLEDWRRRQGILASAQYQLILRAEAAQARPMREIVDALLSGTPPSSASIARFDAIKIEIDTARNRYALIVAAKTSEELANLSPE